MPRIESPTNTKLEISASPEPGSHETLYVIDVNFDWSVLKPHANPDYKAVVLFGVDPQEQRNPALLTSFPLFKKDPDHANTNTLITNMLRPEYQEKFGIKKELRFPTFEKIAPALSPHIRHEIGYSLLMLAMNPDHEGAEKPTRLKEALRNSGNLFLMSAGVRWHMNPPEQNSLERIYREEMQPLWGRAPTEAHSSVRGTDMQLRAMKQSDGATILMSQDWRDIADMGHGLEYMMLINKLNGGLNQIVGVGSGIPKTYGTPIGAGYLEMRIPKSAK